MQASPRRLELFAAAALASWLSCCRSSEPPGRPSAPAASTAPLVRNTPEVPGAVTAGTPGQTKAAPRAEASSTVRRELELPPVEQRLVPDRKAGERLPLVLFLHGLGASAATAFEVLPLGRFGAASRVHVIAADGTLDSKGRRFWNAGASCCNFDHKSVDDVARLGELLARWAERPEVDPDRVYLMGVSNGAFMAQRLACERSEHVAAVAALSGALEKSGDCPRLGRIGVLLVHGDADAIVGYGAGRVFDDPQLAEHLSARDGFREWGRRLGCRGEPKQGADFDLDPKLPGKETRSERFEHCPGGDSALFTVRGGSHYVASRTGVFETAWNYLLAHRKR
jgi:polyhydroxybutyrate depolymerase